MNDTSSNTPREAEAVDLEHDGRVGGQRNGRREDVLDGSRPVISRMSSAVGVSATARPLAIAAAVLEHGDAVADLADLLEPVRDVDDGDARRR